LQYTKHVSPVHVSLGQDTFDYSPLYVHEALPLDSFFYISINLFCSLKCMHCTWQMLSSSSPRLTVWIKQQNTLNTIFPYFRLFFSTPDISRWREPFSNFPWRFEFSGIDWIYVEVNKTSYKIHRFQRFSILQYLLFDTIVNTCKASNLCSWQPPLNLNGTLFSNMQYSLERNSAWNTDCRAQFL